LIANTYPIEAEIVKGLRKREGCKPLPEILELAKRAAGVLADESVNRSRFTGSIFLDSGLTKLIHFPVSKVRVADQAVDRLGVDELNGILTMMMPPDEYEVSYEVGYSDGSVPAVIKELVTALSRYLYSGSDDFRSEVVELAEVARSVRKRARDRRNDYQVDREGSSERFTRHSPSGCFPRP